MFVYCTFIFAILLALNTAIIIDQSKCPVGWESISDQCIRLFQTALTYDQAEGSCAQEGGELLSVIRNSQIDKVLIHELNEPIEKARELGFNDQTFLIGGLRAAMADPQLTYDLWLTNNRIKQEKRQSMRRKVLALQRNVEANEITMTSVPAEAVFPYICTLLPLTKLKLLYEQAFMPTGAPKFIEEPNTAYHYINRADGHFITLPCRASGNPETKIRWFRSGIEEIDIESANSSFVISGGSLLIPIGKRNLDEVSTFHCTASNSLGLMKRTRTIRSVATIIRPSFIDPFRSSRLDAYPLSSRGQGTRLDCQAPPHYPKSYSFSWMIGGLTDQFVSVNERIFISMDGTLHFSYNRPEDATSYACTLASSSSRSGQYGPFFHLLLPQNGEAGSFPPRIDEYQPQVFPEVPIRGQTIWIESPKYRWERLDGEPFNSRYKILNYGRVLRIEGVRQSDATHFRCTATNERGSATAELQLVIQFPPIIAQPLADLLVATNSTVRLACPIVNQQSPTVHVEWFRNGLPIQPVLMAADERKRFRLHQNELAISRVHVEDAQVYQCRISNDVGTASSSMLLTVQDSKPIFHPNVFPRRVFVVDGSSLRLPCLFYSMPRGSSRWQRLTRERDSNTRPLFDQVEENGIVLLLIESFTVQHQGDYECRARNDFGESRAVVQLVVMTRPKVSISQSVKPDADGEGYGLQLSCEAELECATQSSCPEAHFQWQFNEQNAQRMRELRVRQFVRSIGESERSTKIRQHASVDASSSFVAKNVGRFACSSVFGGASAEIEPPGISRLAAIAPTQLKVLSVDSNSAKLSWRLAPIQKRHEFRIDGFQVEKRTGDDRTWRPHSNEPFRTGDRIIGAFLVRDLRPNSKYQFRVRTRSTDGVLSLPSASTPWIETPVAAPDDVIANLRWKLLDSSHLLLEWDPIEKSHHNGPNLRYNVTWTGNDDNGSHVVDRANYVIPLRPDNLHRNPETDCAILAVGVQAMNDVGTSMTTETIVYVTDQAPKRQAVNLHLQTYNATHLNLTWDWANAEQCENVRGIMISCIDEWEDVDSKPRIVIPENSILNLTVPPHTSEVLVGGLEAWTVYRCSLVAFDQHGRRGPQSLTSESARTAEPPPFEAPSILRIKLHETLSGYTTLIDWTMVRLSTVLNASEERGYYVYVFVSETAENPIVLELREREMIDVRNPSARIDGLKLMFLYRIQVAAFNAGGVGPRSAVTTIRIGASDQSTPDSAYRYCSSWLTIGLFLLLRTWIV
ncbi:hypothetical protein M3Y96_00747000 [Aphelenchoides besseyi]|nr:hypothetical protein M3Y96_00747000 [Aphelenchoides besseyi]